MSAPGRVASSRTRTVQSGAGPARHVLWSLLLALGAGLSLWLAHPPVGWWVVSFATVPLLLTAVALRPEPSRARDGVVAFGLGLVAGLVGYGPMLWWLVLPAGVVAWALVVAVQASFVGLTAVVLASAVSRWWVVVVAPVAWVAMEAWRGAVPLGGFDWGALAYAHAGDQWLVPVARILGSRGITLAVVLVGALAFEVVRRLWRKDRTAGVRARLRAAAPALAALAATVAATGLAHLVQPPPGGRDVEVLAVQGNDLGPPPGSRTAPEAAPTRDRAPRSLPPEAAPTRDRARRDRLIARRMLAETQRAVAAGGAADLTVWPESSIDGDPYGPGADPLREVVGAAGQLTDGRLTIGMSLRGPRPGTRYNASVLVDEKGRPVDTYAKRHLVPFGEYDPTGGALDSLHPYLRGLREVVPGSGPQRLEVDIDGRPVAVAPAICFETLFSETVRTNLLAGDEPAGLVLATTNDASYGRSAEPAQHLAQSRLRAVETGRWVVHAALSGSSAFVDPRGGVHQTTELFTVASIRRSVPLATGTTPFLEVGDVLGGLARVLGVGLLGWVGAATWRRRRGGAR